MKFSKPMKRVVCILTIMAMLLVIPFTGASVSMVFADETPVVELAAPENVTAEYTTVYDNSGDAYIKWDPVEGANAYELIIKKGDEEIDREWIPAIGRDGYNAKGGTYYIFRASGVFTFSVRAAIEGSGDTATVYGPESASVKLAKVKNSVTWKKPAKNGRVYTVKWKKDKTADGYLLEYSFLKSTDLKIESKTYKKTISAKKTSFKLKKMPKKYDIVWIRMKPYIKSGDKKICYDNTQTYEIKKKSIYRR